MTGRIGRMGPRHRISSTAGETIIEVADNSHSRNQIHLFCLLPKTHISLSFLLHDQRKETKEPPSKRGLYQASLLGKLHSSVAKNTSHSDFGGDTTRYAQTVSPLIEILAPFLTHRHDAGRNRHANPRASVE